MKRFVTLIVVVLMILCGSAAAEGVDVSSMSDEELAALRDSINVELTARNGFSNPTLYPGVYVGGESIAPGGYVLTCENFSYPDVSENAFIYLYIDAEHREDYDIFDIRLVSAIGRSIFIQLSQGTILEIDGGSFTIEKTNSSTSSGGKRQTASPTSAPTKESAISDAFKSLKPIQSISSSTTAPETPDSNTVTPEFKKFMDDYEEFIDGYVKFMNEYNSSDDMFGMIDEYLEYMEDYCELMDSIDTIDEHELSDADSIYYLTVTARVLTKLNDIEY